MQTKGISGSTLKWIAILLMVIDHIGASIIEVFMMNIYGTAPVGQYFYEHWDTVYAIDRVLRSVGRPAFPIFCFLLVEGFLHTRDVKKYALRLGMFALISDIPFDLAIRNQMFCWEYQNVYFTLLIGLLTIWAMREFAEKQKRVPGMILQIGTIVVGCLLAEFLHTDYGYFGVALIVVLYSFKEARFFQCGMGAITCAWEMPAPLAFLPILFYNGERGHQPKWLFYWFYPIHLFLYYMIGNWLIPAIIL